MRVGLRLKHLKGENAFKQMEKSLEEGLPFERYQAGPRPLFTALYERNDYKVLARDARDIIHGLS